MFHKQVNLKALSLTVFWLFLAAPVFAQQPGPPPIDKSMNAERIRQQEMSGREWQLRNFGNEPERPKDRKQLEALMVQTGEDFTRILTIHNEFARFIASQDPLNYHSVAESAAEIRKRATRLQSTLVLPPEDTQLEEKSVELNDTQMREALVKLCKQIKSFVTNPIIETPNTVDANQLVRARQDLQSVVRVSEEIRKNANRLSKTKN